MASAGQRSSSLSNTQRDEKQRRDDAEPDGHHQEGDTEARLLGERLEIAVREIRDRQLQRIRRPQHEPRDADVDHEEGGDDRDEMEALLEHVAEPRRAGRGVGRPSGPISERERARRAPTARRRRATSSPSADRVGRRRRGDADAEREDARRGVAVFRRSRASAPCTPFRRASPETGAMTTPPSADRPRGAGEHRAVGREHLHRVRGDRHGLAEAEPDLGRRRLTRDCVAGLRARRA